MLRQVTFCKKTNANVLGIIETMSGFVCPNCSDCGLLFGQGGGKRLADHCNINFLGSIPIDPNLSRALDKGELLQNLSSSPSAQSYCDIAKLLTKT